MKKFLCVIFCILTAFCFVGCKEEAAVELQEPPVVELMARTVTNEYKIAITDDEGNVWLENADIITVAEMHKNGQKSWLELRFTEEGTKKFKKAVKKSKKGVLSITIDGEIFVPELVANQETPEYARADGIYDDIMKWFNKLT